jgi:RNA polymerase sigma factor (sigma-70 family)
MLAALIWSGRPKSCTIDLDDMVQLGSIGLMQAIESYDQFKGCTFRVYAQYRIKGAILDEIRDQRSDREQVELTEDMISEQPSIDDVIDARRMLDQLPERERIVLEMRYIHGTHVQSIADRMDCSKRKVEYLQRGALDHLKHRAAA